MSQGYKERKEEREDEWKTGREIKWKEKKCHSRKYELTLISWLLSHSTGSHMTPHKPFLKEAKDQLIVIWKYNEGPLTKSLYNWSLCFFLSNEHFRISSSTEDFLENPVLKWAGAFGSWRAWSVFCLSLLPRLLSAEGGCICSAVLQLHPPELLCFAAAAAAAAWKMNTHS